MNIIYKNKIDALRGVINSARSKWGLAQDTPSVNVGELLRSDYINQLSNKLTEAKHRSGWNGSITTARKGEVIRDITGDITSQAHSIQNFCTCYGNCKGGCSGSCAGECRSSCEGQCTGYRSCGRSSS